MKDIDPSVRSRQVRVLYWAAQDQPAGERAQWLVSASGGDDRLLAEVAALGEMLEPAEGDESIVADKPPTAIAAAVSAAFGHDDSNDAGVKAGDRLGPYTLVRELGRGGMGVVFEALEDPPLSRTVAVKVIRSGMVSAEVVTRFELERHILAELNHPNIARVFSAGSTSTGRPWFAMELVRGKKITDYCDDKKLGILQRIQLMVPVCQAVEHANNLSIFHRDIKPHNVLVTEDEQGRPVPKVIDFGIAKATELSDKVRAMVTATNAVLGTQIYWSPEQAGVIKSPIDKRTDVYLLGNLLYELLTSTPRIDPAMLQENALAQVLALLGAEAPRPRERLSTLGRARLSSVAQARQSDPEQIGKLVGREPEWVVMKALQIEPDRRYQSAAELARDLENCLAGRPTNATPEDWLHKTWKTVRTHKLAVSVGGAVFLGLLIAAVGLGAGFVRAQKAERVANDQRKTAEAARDDADHQQKNTAAVVEFLVHDLLGSARPDRTPDKAVRDVIVEKMLRPAADAVDEQFAHRPDLRATLQINLSQIFRQLGRPELSMKMAQSALDTSQSHDSPNEVNAFLAELELASDQTIVGKLSDAETHFKRLIAKTQQPDGERFNIGGTLPDLLRKYAMIEMGLQHPVEALAGGRLALERTRQFFGEEDSRTLDAQNTLVGILQSQGKVNEAAPLAEDALARSRRLLGPDHSTTMQAEFSLAVVYSRLGRLADAERLDREALDSRRRVFGPDHPLAIQQEVMLSAILFDSGRPNDAEPFARDAWNRRERVSSKDQMIVANAGTILVAVLNKLDHPAEAEPIVRDLCPLQAQIFGAQSPQAIMAQVSWAQALMGLKRFAEAEKPARFAFDAATHTLDERNPLVLNASAAFCDMLQMTGRAGEAEPIVRCAFENAVKVWAKNDPKMQEVREVYARVLLKAGRVDDAKIIASGGSLSSATQPAAAPATRIAATMPLR